jgi:hypothetical protein
VRSVGARQAGLETAERAGVRLKGVHAAPAHARTARLRVRGCWHTNAFEFLKGV